ncbi:hypothetical protein REPUB_Repub01dG0147600 [Reevesia pubescens]
MLQRIRGILDANAEFHDLVEASEAAKKVEHPWRSILIEPRYRPQLILFSLPAAHWHQCYAPVLFKTLGFGHNASFMTAVISGSTNMLPTIVSIYSVDKFGKRILF